MNRRGMTLLELVVGLTITGLVITAGFAALQVLQDRRAQAEAVMNAVTRAANERTQIAQWIAGARLTVEEGGPAFRGLDGVHDGIHDDAIAFLTTAPTPLGTGETLVQLYVDRDSATPEQGLTAVFSEWRGTATRRVELDRSVASLEARYLSNVMGQRVWLPSWVSSTVLPAAVEIRLLPAANDTLPPLLQLPILVPLRGGS
ncbi:MAG TPA: type II secretion system protein [Gemmatimonadales bacterium]|nr:type II secretion system protein [Gemmatimonadales bacterium]